MRRLALRLPTALQVNKCQAILFHEHGVSEFADLDNPLSYDLLASTSNDYRKRVWALVDIGPNLQKPVGIFQCSSHFFVDVSLFRPQHMAQ